MLYVFNDTGYISLKDDFSSLIKIDNESFDFSEIFNIDKTKISKEDMQYIISAYRNIVIESIDANDFKKSSDTIKIDGKDTKVNKLHYELTDKKYQEIIGNIVTKTLEDSKLVSILAKISDSEVDDIKDELNYIKENAKEEEFDGQINIDIYTNPVTSSVIGTDIQLTESNKVQIRVNGDTTKIDLIEETTNIGNITIKKSDENTYDINVNIPQSEIAANIVISSKETSKNNYEGSFKIKVMYEGQYVNIETNYTETIGATIANVDTSSAKNMSELTEQEKNDISQKYTTRFESSKLYTVLEELLGYSDETYDLDYNSL